MEFNEKINTTLLESGSPLTIIEIHESLLTNYSRKDLPATFSQSTLIETIKKNPSLFLDINGRIIPISLRKWKNILTAYWYIVNILRDSYTHSDLQKIVPSLFFHKRCRDLSLFPFIRPDDNWNTATPTSLEDWLYEMHSLEKYQASELGLSKELGELLSRLPTYRTNEVLHMIHEVDTRDFSEHEYGALFEYIIEANTLDTHKTSAIRTPQQICNLMAALLDIRGGSVYDPVCGTGGLLSSVLRHHKEKQLFLKGTEINRSSAKLAYMTLIMYGANNREIKVSDCFNEIFNNEKYDYIIADLPSLNFNSSTPAIQNLMSFDFPAGKGFNPFIYLITSKLSSFGKAVITVADSFLSFGGAEERCRKMLIDEDLIESIISLPMGSLKPYTNGKASILILNKAKESFLIGKIKFITASSAPTHSQSLILDTTSIVSLNNEKTSEHKNFQIVKTEDISQNNSLNPNTYSENFEELKKLLTEKKAYTLRDLVKIRSGVSSKDIAPSDFEIPYIKIENLEKDILDMRLATDRITHSSPKNLYTTKHIVKNEALLIARIGENLKPTIFKPNKRVFEIITHHGVIVLEPHSDKVIDIEYLYYQLYSPIVQKQIELRRSGTVMPFISQRVLNDIIIPYIPLNSQREFITTQKTNIIAAEKEKINQRLMAIGLEEESIQKEADIISTLVHELRPKLIKLNTYSNKLIRIIKKHGISNLTEYIDLQDTEEDLAEVEPLENKSLDLVAQIIQRSSKELNDTLSIVKDVMNFNLQESDFIKIDILEFLREYASNKTEEQNPRYSIEVRGSNSQLYLHKASMMQIIDQLLSNAEKHAFREPTAKDKVIFTVKEDEDRGVTTLDYSNNGAPFPLTKQEYIQFFKKSKASDGSGIGGNYIYRIVRAHNGDIEIKENTKKGFSLKIELPTKRNDHV